MLHEIPIIITPGPWRSLSFISSDSSITWLIFTKYLFHKWPRLRSVLIVIVIQIITSFMTYHRVSNLSNTTGATFEAGTAYHSGAYELPPFVYWSKWGSCCHTTISAWHWCSIHLPFVFYGVHVFLYLYLFTCSIVQRDFHFRWCSVSLNSNTTCGTCVAGTANLPGIPEFTPSF